MNLEHTKPVAQSRLLKRLSLVYMMFICNAHKSRWFSVVNLLSTTGLSMYCSPTSSYLHTIYSYLTFSSTDFSLNNFHNRLMLEYPVLVFFFFLFVCFPFLLFLKFTLRDDFIHCQAFFIRHESDDRENDESRK